jgi:hypothetical protein
METTEPNVATTAALDPEVIDGDKAAEALRPNNLPLNLPIPTIAGIPEWAKIPEGLVFPKNKQVMFMRFRANMTDTPLKGERQAIVWSNNIGDQRVAIMRSDRDPNKMQDQMTKQTIRAVDGVLIDQSGEVLVTGNVDIWWDEIGPKCRNILDKLFMQLHFAQPAEAKDFFENCVAVRVVGG